MSIEIEPTLKQDGTPHAGYDRLPRQFEDAVRESGPLSYSVDLRVYVGRKWDGTPWSHVYFMRDGKLLGPAFPLNPRTSTGQPLWTLPAKLLENITRLLFRKMEDRS